MHKARLTKWQKRIFLSCFIAYVGAYIARVNMSVALPEIASELTLTGAQAGMLGTVFSIAYASGQMLMGYIADRLSARRFIIIGLCASSVINLAFGLTGSYPAMLLIWLLNGAFQSMLWTPIVKTMARWFEKEQRGFISFGLSMTLILGYLLAWGLAGFAAAYFSWRAAFFIPSAVTALIALLSGVGLRDHPEQVGHPAPAYIRKDGESKPKKMKISALLFRAGLIFMVVCGISTGMVRDSIMLWAPTMLMETQGIDLDSALGITLIIPLINFLGIILGNALNRLMGYNGRKTVALMTLMTAGVSVLLISMLHVNTLLCSLLLGACSALMYGINPILTTMLPMEYEKYGMSATAAGLIDGSIYIGSGLAGVLTGWVVDLSGWVSVFWLWVALLIIGSLFMYFGAKKADLRKEAA